MEYCHLLFVCAPQDLLMTTFHLRLKRISMPKQTRLKFDLEKLKDPSVFRHLSSYDRQEVCTSHHHEQWRSRHGLSDYHLQHSSDWNSQWDPWQTSSEVKKTLGHCRNSWSMRQGSRTEKETIWTWRIWEIQGNEQQHQEVHEKGKRKLDRRTV